VAAGFHSPGLVIHLPNMNGPLHDYEDRNLLPGVYRAVVQGHRMSYYCGGFFLNLERDQSPTGRVKFHLTYMAWDAGCKVFRQSQCSRQLQCLEVLNQLHAGHMELNFFVVRSFENISVYAFVRGAPKFCSIGSVAGKRMTSP
jgi:hypothetical protein